MQSCVCEFSSHIKTHHLTDMLWNKQIINQCSWWSIPIMAIEVTLTAWSYLWVTKTKIGLATKITCQEQFNEPKRFNSLSVVECSKLVELINENSYNCSAWLKTPYYMSPVRHLFSMLRQPVWASTSSRVLKSIFLVSVINFTIYFSDIFLLSLLAFLTQMSVVSTSYIFKPGL